ncbi:MAG: hypothetical protein COU81_04130 [Candidatus Portnoybacteria bacterium CG10_big_fil_rev_8_21_14_0_10_36_7]|uniref:Uncharacterized protein n=1 Tax=Candidatus Portnoybacteria bacterium CG10_big_fil_rev_8_21_14_0_10_36_7 TaxID=1974812 RepID=A0A2M8KD38_9BACT|nr:MAG: hypothetical protein COU81_04130 [Candidatus Portnoybacteria bacterium CG10_big_fil_rev_8_21_14_0_10_36_7]
MLKDSLPHLTSQGVSQAVPPIVPVPKPDEKGTAQIIIKREGFLSGKLKFLIILFFVLLFAGGSVFAVKFYLDRKITNYSLIPDDADFYLGLSIKTHPQVQKLLELSKKLPGGEKMVKYLDKQRTEIFGTRKDPFKQILDLAETEIFLAKVSKNDPNINNRNFGIDTLEQLVNVVQVKNSKTAKQELADIESNGNVITSKEAYASAKIAKFELKVQNKDDTTEQFATGALPYQVTLPLSKTIYSTAINKYIIAAEKESDIKKILDLTSGSKDKKMKSISEDSEHNEIINLFPKEYLLKFYQKQVMSPLSNLLPATSLPQTAFGGTSYDTRERSESGDNVFTVKRGLTVDVIDNGINFTSYQFTKNQVLKEGLKHGFTIENSQANNLPAVFNTKQPLFYAEGKNVKESIQDQIDELKNVSDNSSDDNQKKSFENTIKGIEEMKNQAGKLLGVDVDSDLLAWMDGSASIIVAPGFNGQAPDVLFVFEVKKPSDVEAKLAKISLPNFVEQAKMSKRISKDNSRRSYTGQLQRALELYKKDNNRYPDNIEALSPKYYSSLKYIKDPKNDFSFSYTVRGKGEGYELKADLDLAEDIVISEISPKITYAYPEKSENTERVFPQASDFNGKKIYSLPIYDFRGDTFSLRFAVNDKYAIISVGASDQAIKDILEFQKTDTNTLAKDSDWKNQFAKAPKIIGGVVFIVPENVMGIVDYFMTKNSGYSEYVQEDYMTIAKGYLKALRSIGTTTTQSGHVVISNTFVNIEELEGDEINKVENALDRVLSGRPDQTTTENSVFTRTAQARDAQIKNDIGALATELQGYYTTPGQGKYPAQLKIFVDNGQLKALPKTPSGLDYTYITCSNNTESLLYAQLETRNGYWVWTSASGRAVETAKLPSAETCTKGILGTKDSLFNLFKKS